MPHALTRPALLLAVACLALAGCGTGEPAASTGQPTADTTTYLPSAEASPSAPAHDWTARETKFLAAIHKYPKLAGDSTDEVLVQTAEDFCGIGSAEDSVYTQYGAHPPNVDGIIEYQDFVKGFERFSVAHMCPKYADVLRRGLAGFQTGDQDVGKDIKPGVYRTTSRKVHGCYWERTTPAGKTIANSFVTYARAGVTVTIGAGDGGFTSRDCGNWAPA